MKRKVALISALIPLAALGILVAASTDATAKPPSQPVPTPGVWLHNGQDVCGPGQICADWFTMPGGVRITNCCIPEALEGSQDYQACPRFRETHRL